MINVLEHVINPLDILRKCHTLLSEKGVLLIQVPKDFSRLQEYLFNKNKIDKPFWVCTPDHISYFNSGGLLNLCQVVGLKKHKILGDFPIDMNLFNSNTNYVMDKSKGKSCHKARVEIENFLHENKSLREINSLYEALGEMGLGREIIILLTK